MFTSINNIRIFPRLFILFTTLVIISSVAMVFLGFFFIQTEQTHAQAVKTSFDSQQIATTEQINLQRMNALLQARFAQIFAADNQQLQGDPSLTASGGLISDDIVARETDFNQMIQTYNTTYSISSSSNQNTIRSILKSDPANTHLITDQQTALNNVISTQWNAYKGLQDQVLNQLASQNPRYNTAYEILYQADQKFLDLQKSWDEVVTIATSVGQAVTTLTNAEIVPLEIATAIAAILIIAVIALTAFIVNSTISKRLGQLASLTGRIAQGKMRERVSVGGRDEIQVVASSMNTMLDNIVRLLQEAETRHTTLQQQVEKLINEVRGAGDGDLRVQAEVPPDSLGILANFINYMIMQLGSLVINFKTLANEVERATIQTYDDMTQLVDGSDLQIQQITAATTSVQEMTNTSRNVAQRAQSLAQVGRKVYETTQSGRVAVIHTVEGMENIKNNVHVSAAKIQALAEHSHAINDIVRIIAGIAYQTNRLALDASIQAAMAGENGKAFRAVADDIRRAAEVAKTQTNLAERIVKQVFEEIQDVTLSIQNTELETATGTQSSQDAGIAFEAIFAAIRQQAQEIEMINQAAEQQLQVSSNVVQIMQAVSTSTVQNTQSLHKESQRMERVAELAEQLLGYAEVFKLRDDQDIFAAPQEQSMMQQGIPQQSFPNMSYPGYPSQEDLYPFQTNSF
ncbi:methyl-accepting chemotaxis protein [Ktedonobacteria bacterium brp13]|nr:methyl-accepting chemotaxis protein [Ktedonobacteria bacterium brp13]